MPQIEKTDEELVLLAREDRKTMEALCAKYKPLVLKYAKSLFLIGGETDDLIQEGMMGLFSAILTYDESKGASFMTFASICVHRQMLKAIESANTKKNSPLNNYVSLLDDEWEEILSGNDPESVIIGEENSKDLIAQVKEVLSPMEQEVFDYYLEGKNYKEIAEIMGKTPKNIDNALTRIRNKAKSINY